MVVFLARLVTSLVFCICFGGAFQCFFNTFLHRFLIYTLFHVHWVMHSLVGGHFRVGMEPLLVRKEKGSGRLFHYVLTCIVWTGAIPVLDSLTWLGCK